MLDQAYMPRSQRPLFLLSKLKFLFDEAPIHPKYHDFPRKLLAIRQYTRSAVRWLAIVIHILPLGLDHSYLPP